MFQVASHPTSFAPQMHHHSYNSQSQNASSPVQLPRTLSRPPFAEVSREAILAVAPDLGDVPPEYIRRGLRSKAAEMMAGISSLAPSHLPSSMPKSHLPSSLTVPTRPSPSASSYPTHVLALSSSKSQSPSDTLPLFAIHSLVLASHCALLPRLPPSSQHAGANHVKLPVLPLTLPSPSAFPILLSFMYTHRLDALFNSLLPFPPSFLSSISPQNVKATLASGPSLHQLSSHVCSASSSSLQTLTTHAAHITALWRNCAALGLHDPELWDAMDLAWEVVLGALNLAAAGH